MGSRRCPWASPIRSPTTSSECSLLSRNSWASTTSEPETFRLSEKSPILCRLRSVSLFQLCPRLPLGLQPLGPQPLCPQHLSLQHLCPQQFSPQLVLEPRLTAVLTSTSVSSSTSQGASVTMIRASFPVETTRATTGSTSPSSWRSSSRT